MSSAPVLLRTRGLTKRYPAVTAVDDLDVEVPAGRVGLVGANGAGKTTLFRMMLGVSHPTRGLARGLRHRRGPGSHRRAEPPRLHARARLPPARPDGRRHRGHLRRARAGSRPGRPASARPTSSTSSASTRRASGPSAASPPACDSAPSSPRRSWPTPSWCCSTSPPPASTRSAARRCSTWSPASAASASRVLLATHLLDDVQQVCDHVIMLDGGRLVVSGSTSGLLERTGRAHRRRRPRAATASSPCSAQRGLAGRGRRRARSTCRCRATTTSTGCATPSPTSGCRCTA